MNVGFIGCGQMATALATGVSRECQLDCVYAFDPSHDALEKWTMLLKPTNTPLQTCQSNQQVVENSQYVFLAVKPQMISEVAKQISAKPANIFVSVIAGTSIATLEELLNSDSVIRAMPNTPCLIGKGATAVSSNGNIRSEQLRFVTEMFSSVGKVVNVNENLMDAITGLSGSGPAYVYTFIEAMVDAGVLAGLPRDVARTMSLQTILGATEMVDESKESPAVLRDRVTSPGGTTIHGMEQLEQKGFRGSILAAVNAATNRSRELGS